MNFSGSFLLLSSIRFVEKFVLKLFYLPLFVLYFSFCCIKISPLLTLSEGFCLCRKILNVLLNALYFHTDLLCNCTNFSTSQIPVSPKWQSWFSSFAPVNV